MLASSVLQILADLANCGATQDCKQCNISKRSDADRAWYSKSDEILYSSHMLSLQEGAQCSLPLKNGVWAVMRAAWASPCWTLHWSLALPALEAQPGYLVICSCSSAQLDCHLTQAAWGCAKLLAAVLAFSAWCC